jgi:hypothetical protein
LFKEVPGKKKTATEEERLLHIPPPIALRPLCSHSLDWAVFLCFSEQIHELFALFFFLQLFAFPSLFRLRIELYSCGISSVAGGKRERQRQQQVEREKESSCSRSVRHQQKRCCIFLRTRGRRRMSKQGTGDIPSLSTMSDLGAALPPGNGGTVSVYA